MAAQLPLVVTASEHANRKERARRLDALAGELLAALAPLSFELVRTTADRDAALRLRYECMLEFGWLRPEDYPDGRAADEYDREALLVVGKDGGEAVSSMRVVPPDPVRPLPVERECGIPLRARDGVFEFGRLSVPRRHRPGRSHLLIAGLCARGWIESRARGCVRAISSATPELIDLYRGLGLQVAVLGPAHLYSGEQRVPIEFTGADASTPMLARQPSSGSDSS